MAECFVNVSIPDASGKPLSLAGVLVGVYFCPALQQVQAKILHLSPSPALTEDELEGAVEYLMEAAMTASAVHGEGAASGTTQE